MKKPSTKEINIEMMKQMGVKMPMPEVKKVSKMKKKMKKMTMKHHDGDHEYR